MSKVEEYKLVDITLGIHTGLNPRKNFKLNTFDAQFYYVTVKEIASNKVVFSNNTDKINAEAWSVIQNRSHLSKGDVLFSGIGTIGKVAYVNDNPKNWNCSESVYIIKPFNGLLGKYLYYILQTNKVISQYEANSAGSIMKGVRKANLEQIKIPLPHIKVQEEIVEILDSFTNLIDTLNEELSLRQKQFEHYREKLLTFEDTIQQKEIGELCSKVENIKWSSDVELNYIDLSSIPCKENRINDCQLISRENAPSRARQIIKTNDILFGTTRPTQMRLCIVPEEYNNQICSTGYCVLRLNNMNHKYIYYCLSSSRFMDYCDLCQDGGSYPSISDSKVKAYEVPIPSSSIQQSIVEKLDAFESLISSLKEEIALRQKQYEYYREKLLTFD